MRPAAWHAADSNTSSCKLSESAFHAPVVICCRMQREVCAGWLGGIMSDRISFPFELLHPQNDKMLITCGNTLWTHSGFRLPLLA